jgi:hypothetical protein
MADDQKQYIKQTKQEFDKKLNLLRKNRDVLLSKFRKKLEEEKISEIRRQIIDSK